MIAALALLETRPLGALFDLEWGSWQTLTMFGALLLMIIMGSWTGAVAARKGRSMQSWFIIGFFLPVIGLIAIYILKPIQAKRSPPKK